MIKKLRMKFVAVNMAIATAMLCVILGMVYSFTSSGLERESLNMMYNIASHPIGLPGEDVRLPYFKIQLGPSGELITAGGGYYDLTDHDFLENLIDTALKSPKNFGVLKEYKLRYYRMDDLMNHCIVFVQRTDDAAPSVKTQSDCWNGWVSAAFGYQHLVIRLGGSSSGTGLETAEAVCG